MTPPPRSRRLARRGLAALGALALLLLLAALLHAPLLRLAARAVEVHEPVARADLMYLLNGDAEIGARAQHAAALYHARVAPRVVIARAEETFSVRRGLYPNETDVNLALLRAAGVPDSALLVLPFPGGATSTADEGVALARHLRSGPARRVMVVTTEYHTRRARWNLRRELERAGVEAELSMAGARDPRFDAADWWRSEAGLLAYVEEYLKFAHNALAR